MEEEKLLMKKEKEFHKKIALISSKGLQYDYTGRNMMIESIFKTVAEYINFDSAFLFVSSDEGVVFKKQYDWFLSPEYSEFYDVDMFYTFQYIYLQKELKRNEYICLETRDEIEMLESDEKNFFMNKNVKSTIIIPIRNKGDITGFLKFDRFKKYQCDPETINTLKYVVEILNNLITSSSIIEEFAKISHEQAVLLNNCYIQIWYLKNITVFGLVNEAFASFFGKRKEELNNKNLYDVFDKQTADFLASNNWDVFQKKTEITKELWFKNFVGESRLLSITWTPKIGEDGSTEYAICSATDITEIRQVADSLKMAKESAEESARMKCQFLANMSHEIRTPLNSIIGMTELLIDSKLPQKQKELLDTMNNAGKMLLGIINNVLDMAKIETGKIKFNKIEFDLCDVVEKTSGILYGKAREKKVRIHTFVSEDVPMLIGEPERVEQILLNLVGNSIKFTQKGEISIFADIKNKSDEKITIEFRVEDTGIGIPEDLKERIFEPFEQADGSSSRKYGGSGLGLAITKHLIELMNGSISFESKEGKGTTFWFTAQFDYVTGNDTQNQLLDFKKRNILIIDRSKNEINVLKDYLNPYSLNCHYYKSLSNIKRRNDKIKIQYDLIFFSAPKKGLLKYQIQGDLIKKEILTTKRTPIVLITDEDMDSKEKKEARKGGFSTVLKRPLKKDDILRCVNKKHSSKERKSTKEKFDENSCASCKYTVENEEIISCSDRYIMVVEDVLANRKLAELQINKLGYKVNAVEGGYEAIEEFEKNHAKYFLIFMDCQMPLIDGFDTTKRIKEIAESKEIFIPVVAMTANAMEGDDQKCKESGMDDYLSKPITINSLRQMIEKWTCKKEVLGDGKYRTLY